MDVIPRELSDLPQELRYRGEFGPELVLFLPFVTWLSRMGLLRDRRVITYPGMKCFYDDLDCREVVHEAGERQFVKPSERPAWLPVKDEHTYAGPSPHPLHSYPDLRAKFGARPLPGLGALEGRPLLVIHNKRNREWGGDPVNFFSLEHLDYAFRELERHFNVVYIRHGRTSDLPGYSSDRAVIDADYDETPILAHHPKVHYFDRLFQAFVAAGGPEDMNDFKNRLYARCYHFLTVQGGGAHQCAMYSGSLLCVQHHQGSEKRVAYKDGYYGFVANPAPVRIIFRDVTLQDTVTALIGRRVRRKTRVSLLKRLFPSRPENPQVVGKRAVLSPGMPDWMPDWSLHT